MVVCRQLGYAWECKTSINILLSHVSSKNLYTGSLAERNGLFGRSDTRNVATDFHCSGREQHLADCSYTSITRSSGFGYEWYYSSGVICQGNTSAPTECEHGAVRLTDGKKSTEGRVEICAHGYWATTCYNNWNKIATQIVCRQLGLPTSGEKVIMMCICNKILLSSSLLCSIIILGRLTFLLILQRWNMYLIIDLVPTISYQLLVFTAAM